MKVVSVSPELISDMIASYLDTHPDHEEGDLELHIATNSWRAFQKRVGWSGTPIEQVVEES